MTNNPFGVSPLDIAWDVIHADGSKSATLVGTRDDGVQFTYAFFVPAGLWDAPHSHPSDAHVHVASGVLSIGYGATLSPDRAETFGTGSFIFVPAGTVHFDGSEEDTVLIGTAIGPWATDYVIST
jgi:quercetin dioxygenase-like cupin family protein